MGMPMGQLGLRHALARLRGKQIQIARRQERAKQRLAAIHQELAQLENEAATTAQEVALLSTALVSVFADPGTSVEPRQTYPKLHLGAWGSVTRTILGIFRDANGGPLLATELASQVQERLGVELNTPDEQHKFRRHIGRRLKGMYHSGYLERLHDPAKSGEGIWELKASSE